MTELPPLNSVDIDCCGTEDARLWKRVRTLESSLGYSNYAVEGFSNKQNRSGQVDSHGLSTQPRKRRLPRVGPSTRVEGSAPQADLLDSRSTPSLSLLSGKLSAPPWTQPTSQCTSTGRGNIPLALTSPRETERSRALERSRGHGVIATAGAEEAMGGGRSSKNEVTSLGESVFPEGLFEANQTVRSQVQAQFSDKIENEHDSETNLKIPVSTRPSEMAAAEGALDASLDTKAERETPTNRGKMPDADGLQKLPRVVMKTLPSGKKLWTTRVGSCRSLVSPNNKVFSSTVVARVKQGLQNGDDEKRPKVLILGSGTFNPIHKVHIRRFHLARNFLQVQRGMRVVGGIVSPSHPTLVRQRHRVRAAEIIPPKHRLSMARAAVGEGSWLAVDPWEVTRKRIMDYMSVLEHAKEVCHKTFPGHAGNITILYMCQPSQIHHLNPAMLRAGGFGIITVCRPLEKERLLKELSPNFRNIAILVEDSTILSAELERTSSHMVRHLLKQGKSVEGMVGRAVARYIRDNTIAERVSGRKTWTVEDNAFMFDEEDKKDRPYHNLPRLYTRRASQMPLQM